ncbi:MAG: hypothetical protein P4L76_12205 [Beijerinckiaceae bacterium]|nr:hypothetical protein [Beijerinckiaceae bacterium]
MTLPVNRIQDAKLLSGPVSDAGSHVQLTLTPPSSSDGKLFARLTALHQSVFATQGVAGPDSDPPVCPEGGIAHYDPVKGWECI